MAARTKDEPVSEPKNIRATEARLGVRQKLTLLGITPNPTTQEPWPCNPHHLAAGCTPMVRRS
jgi:hypothetical protein